MSHTHKPGFTLVELMLAMGFVSALLLAIAMTVIQISNIYTRGITYTNVNQAGGAIANELQRSISSVKSFDPATSFIDEPESGRLCTGSFSYVWNYGKNLKNPGTNFIKYQGQSLGEKPLIYFVKVYDPSSLICVQTGMSLAYPEIVKADAVEMLNSGQFDLAIHGLTIKSPTSAADGTTSQRLYSVQFDIGTNDQNAFDAGTTICSLSGPNSNTNYCSVTRFNITARAGSTTNEENI
jgi:hypothetical protein